jgi:hypothetical protein
MGIIVVVVFSYVAVGGPPRFLGGTPSGGPQMRGAPIGAGQLARSGRDGLREREERGGFERGDGRERRDHADGEGPGGFLGLAGKSLILIGVPLALTFGASWYLFRKSGSSPELTTVGEIPTAD